MAPSKLLYLHPYTSPKPRLSASDITVRKAKTAGECTDEMCQAEHGVRLIEEELALALPSCNALEHQPRSVVDAAAFFDSSPRLEKDGFGHGHDNDHSKITEIKILPTTDEVRISLKICPPAYKC